MQQPVRYETPRIIGTLSVTSPPPLPPRGCVRDWVRDHLTFDNAGMVSVFETTIRVLGGLLSAFDLSRDEVTLKSTRVSRCISGQVLGMG